MNGYILYYRNVQHFNNPDEAHELTFSCYKRRAFLSRERTRLYLGDALQDACARYGFDLWAYVFMPEHVHLLVWPTGEGRSIQKFLQSLKQSVSRRAVLFLRRENPAGLKHLATGQKGTPYRFWQDGGGYDRNMMSPQALANSIAYIHGNPVERGLVQYPEEWKWSSYLDWTEQGTGPVPVQLESFGG